MHCQESLADFVMSTRRFICCFLNDHQYRLELLSDGSVQGGERSNMLHWTTRDCTLTIHGEGAQSCQLRQDQHNILRGRLNREEHVPVILVPTVPPALETDLRNDLEIRVFGQKRSGHHAVMAWLASQLGDGTWFFNDCCPYLDPFRTHTNTQQFIKRYPVLVKHESVGRPPSAPVAETTGEEAQRAEALRPARKKRLLINFEDFDISCSEPHLVPPWFVGTSAKIVNLIVLRDPFNHIASTMQFYGGHLSPQTHERVIEQWKQYAREILGETNYLPSRIAVSYNHWFTSRRYRDQVASWFGAVNTDAGLSEVSPNGGGSSFDKLTYGGQAQDMPVLRRWIDFATDPQFLQYFADADLAKYANALFE